MNRYFSLIPVVIIFTTACDQKAPTVESAPRMVKVAQVTAVGNTSSERFRHALSLAIPPNCRLSGVARWSR